MIMATATLFANAQNSSTAVNRFYLDFGGGAAVNNGAFGQLGATTVIRKKWTESLSYYNVDMRPKNLP